MPNIVIIKLHELLSKVLDLKKQIATTGLQPSSTIESQGEKEEYM